MIDYQADPQLVDVPLHLSEIEELAADPARALKDPRKLMHFVQRTLSTVRIYKTQVRELQREVNEIQQARERAGTATTLAPIDAVRYLSEEQLEQLFGAIAREQLERLRAAQAEAVQVATAARVELQQVRYALSSILEDASVADEVKARFALLLQSLPVQRPAPTLVDPVTGAAVTAEAPPAAAGSAEAPAAGAPVRERGAGWAAWGTPPAVKR